MNLFWSPGADAARVVAEAAPVYVAGGAADRLTAAAGGHRFYPDVAWQAFEAQTVAEVD